MMKEGDGVRGRVNGEHERGQEDDDEARDITIWKCEPDTGRERKKKEIHKSAFNAYNTYRFDSNTVSSTQQTIWLALFSQ